MIFLRRLDREPPDGTFRHPASFASLMEIARSCSNRTSRPDDGRLVEWLAGSNRPEAPIEVRMPGTGVSMVRTRVAHKGSPGDEAPAVFPELTVQLLTRGRLPFVADMGAGRFSATATPGAFIVTPPSQACTISAHADFETLAVALPWRLIEALLGYGGGNDVPDLGRLYAGLLASSSVSGAVETLWSRLSDRGATDPLLLQAELLGILSGLLKLAGTAQRDVARGGLAPALLSRACEAMDAAIPTGISLTELASLVDLSPAHFSRAFRASTGVPPSTWLLHRRIDRAKELLDDPAIGLAQIALSVGFSAQPQFSAAFRRTTGATPGTWRRTRRDL